MIDYLSFEGDFDIKKHLPHCVLVYRCWVCDVIIPRSEVVEHFSDDEVFNFVCPKCGAVVDEVAIDERDLI